MKAPPRCHFPCMTSLAVPIAAAQIHAATSLRAYMPGWRHADDALDAVAARFPDWDMPSILVKVVTVNELYATRLLATARMAEHIHGLLQASDHRVGELALVHEIAALPAAPGKKQRHHRSFASKLLPRRDDLSDLRRAGSPDVALSPGTRHVPGNGRRLRSLRGSVRTIPNRGSRAVQRPGPGPLPLVGGRLPGMGGRATQQHRSRVFPAVLAARASGPTAPRQAPARTDGGPLSCRRMSLGTLRMGPRLEVLRACGFRCPVPPQQPVRRFPPACSPTAWADLPQCGARETRSVVRVENRTRAIARRCQSGILVPVDTSGHTPQARVSGRRLPWATI